MRDPSRARATTGIDTQTPISTRLSKIIDLAVDGRLDKDLAAEVQAMGPEAMFALVMAMAGRLAAVAVPPSSAHTPSAAIPPYAKPATKARRRKPGAKDGHPGRTRKSPRTIDRSEDVPPLSTCPECAGEVLAARKHRRRIIEDIPADTRVEATEYRIPRHWCPTCRTHVEPRVDAALPKAKISNRLTAMTVVFHYGLGLTIDQTREILLSPLQARISAGGLVDIWQRVAEILTPWHDQIAADARASAKLHADETGWRVDGKTHWLWCFANDDACWYMIDRGRGSPAMKRFFTEAFRGVLIHDFWKPYSAAWLEGDGEHQCCLVHLLREIDHVTEKRERDGADAVEWSAFAKKLKRLIRDGIRLRRRADFDPELYASRISRMDGKLAALSAATYTDRDAARLAARLVRHHDEIFTFLDRPESDWNNNFAERQIRPAVILRRNSQCNRSDRGAAAQAVLMSVYRTLKLRGHDPRDAIASALTSYSAAGKLPPLPQPVASG